MAVERGKERERKGGATDGDVVAGKGEPSGLWEHGGCCLGNRYTGRAVASMMSQLS